MKGSAGVDVSSASAASATLAEPCSDVRSGDDETPLESISSVASVKVTRLRFRVTTIACADSDGVEVEVDRSMR